MENSQNPSIEVTRVATQEANTSHKKKSIKDFARDNWLLIFSVFYVIFPFDFIPDGLPLFGGIDDAGVVLIQLYNTYREYMKNESSKV